MTNERWQDGKRQSAGLHCLLPTAYCPLPTAHCLLPTAHCLLPTANAHYERGTIMATRRQFLARTSGLCSLGSIAPALWRQAARAAEPRRDAPLLVVLELSGGNDGLNTVVPYADDIYHKNRPTLRVEPGKILKLNDRVGLHPALKDLHRIWEGGKLAVVQGVGYPDPNRSHFRSMEIWQTGSVGPASPAGWLGRVGDSHPAFELCHVGQGTVPLVFKAGRLSRSRSRAWPTTTWRRGRIFPPRG